MTFSFQENNSNVEDPRTIVEVHPEVAESGPTESSALLGGAEQVQSSQQKEEEANADAELSGKKKKKKRVCIGLSVAAAVVVAVAVALVLVFVVFKKKEEDDKSPAISPPPRRARGECRVRGYFKKTLAEQADAAKTDQDKACREKTSDDCLSQKDTDGNPVCEAAPVVPGRIRLVPGPPRPVPSPARAEAESSMLKSLYGIDADGLASVAPRTQWDTSLLSSDLPRDATRSMQAGIKKLQRAVNEGPKVLLMGGGPVGLYATVKLLEEFQKAGVVPRVVMVENRSAEGMMNREQMYRLRDTPVPKRGFIADKWTSSEYFSGATSKSMDNALCWYPNAPAAVMSADAPSHAGARPFPNCNSAEEVNVAWRPGGELESFEGQPIANVSTSLLQAKMLQRAIVLAEEIAASAGKQREDVLFFDFPSAADGKDAQWLNQYPGLVANEAAKRLAEDKEAEHDPDFVLYAVGGAAGSYGMKQKLAEGFSTPKKTAESKFGQTLYDCDPVFPGTLTLLYGVADDASLPFVGQGVAEDSSSRTAAVPCKEDPSELRKFSCDRETGRWEAGNTAFQCPRDTEHAEMGDRFGCAPIPQGVLEQMFHTKQGGSLKARWIDETYKSEEQTIPCSNTAGGLEVTFRCNHDSGSFYVADGGSCPVDPDRLGADAYMPDEPWCNTGTCFDTGVIRYARKMSGDALMRESTVGDLQFGPQDMYTWPAAAAGKSMVQLLQDKAKEKSYEGKMAKDVEAQLSTGLRQHESRTFHMSGPDRGFSRDAENDKMAAMLAPEQNAGKYSGAPILKPLAPATDPEHPQWMSEAHYVDPHTRLMTAVPEAKREQDIYVSVILPQPDGKLVGKRDASTRDKADIQMLNDCLFEKTMERNGFTNKNQYTWIGKADESEGESKDFDMFAVEKGFEVKEGRARYFFDMVRKPIPSGGQKTVFRAGMGDLILKHHYFTNQGVNTGIRNAKRLIDFVVRPTLHNLEYYRKNARSEAVLTQERGEIHVRKLKNPTLYDAIYDECVNTTRYTPRISL